MSPQYFGDNSFILSLSPGIAENIGLLEYWALTTIPEVDFGDITMLS